MSALATRHGIYCDRCGTALSCTTDQCWKCKPVSVHQLMVDKRRADYPACPTLAFWDRKMAELQAGLPTNIITFNPNFRKGA